MRGKLEQPKGLIELILVELERFDLDYREIWLSYEYTCPGGEYKSAMAVPVTNSRDMTNTFFRELLNEARRLSGLEGTEDQGVGLFVANKAATVLPIKNLCQRVIEVLDEPEPIIESRAYVDLATSGYHFRDEAKSLAALDFDERFRFFMARAREKMDQGYYTLAADDLEKAKILCATTPLIFKLIGICHRELGHLDLAHEMFATALRMGARDEDTFLYLSEVNFFLNSMAEAEQNLSHMLKEFPDHTRALVELANVRYQLGKDYLDLLDRAVERDPEAARQTILQTFVFKKVDQPAKRLINTAEASRLLDLPEKTLIQLAHRHRLPTRSHQDKLMLDESEIKAWAFVYRRFNLLQDEVDRIALVPESGAGQGLALHS